MALQAYSSGRPPSKIFIRADFDFDVIGYEKPKQCLKRWREINDRYGEERLATERHGKNSTGRKPTIEISADEALKRAQAKIKLLEA